MCMYCFERDFKFYSERQQPTGQLRHLASTQHRLAEQYPVAYPLGAEALSPAESLLRGPEGGAKKPNSASI